MERPFLEMRTILSAVALLVAACDGHYSLGYCRDHLTKGGFNSSVTLEELANEGDYTVLYTSGLKEIQDLECAHIGYIQDNATQGYKFYSYIETSDDVRITPYQVQQLETGNFHVIYKDEGYDDDTLLYIMYRNEYALLIYWCNFIPTDTFDNNIWIIAVKSETVNSDQSKEAVLDMLYHDEFRGLIDEDIEVVRKETKRFIKLSPCSG